MTTPLRRALSLSVGWLADRRVPRGLRGPLYRGFSAWSGADPSEAELPLEAYPSLGAFFVRRLASGARPLDPEPAALVSPCDGRMQSAGEIRRGELLQAKGSPYTAAELLAGAAEGLPLEGGLYWTIYLAPRDYHRVHAPADGALSLVRWVPGARRGVSPRTVARRRRILATNERAVLRLERTSGPLFLVMVGAVNVGRIRVVGVEPGATPAVQRPLARGAELARFEMGSTVVLVAPPGAARAEGGPTEGARVRLGERIGTISP